MIDEPTPREPINPLVSIIAVLLFFGLSIAGGVSFATFSSGGAQEREPASLDRSWAPSYPTTSFEKMYRQLRRDPVESMYR